MAFLNTDKAITSQLYLGLIPIILGLGLLRTVINIKRHPLYKFPGPPTASFSNFLYCYYFMSGRQPFRILALHEKYGPVIRIAPNELSFNTSASWKDIYGIRKGHQIFTKSEFYEGNNFADGVHSIIGERDPKEHGAMRKYLSSAFSDRSLKEQEYLVTKNVDLFIDQIGAKGKDGLDLCVWFSLATFDIIGDLAFGKSFDGVATGTEHFWQSILMKGLQMGSVVDCLTRFPWIALVFTKLFSGFLDKFIPETKRHRAYTMDMVKRRIQQQTEQTDRQDFMTRILEAREEDNISDVQIAAHASDFVIAGSETTATALAGATYYLLRNPEILRKLQEEVCTTFAHYEDITAASTASLQYLNAVALETMRIYPPLPFALPRVVPEGGDTVDGHFIPAGTIVSTNPVATNMSSSNFKDPWQFKPERWIGINKEDDLEASQPFSTGPRACIGRSLAWMELRIILAKLHFKYDLELLNDELDWQKASQMHTAWIKPKLMVKVRLRVDS